jgi:hypothetical protein
MERCIDLGGVSVAFAAAGVGRAAALAAALGDLPGYPGRSAVRVELVDDAPSVPHRPPDEVHADLAVWHEGDELALRVGPGFTATADAGAARMGGTTPDLGWAVRRAIQLVVTHVLAHHDRLVLHGGAVARGDRARVVLGGTGAGKSTLVLAALQSGWRALADDLVVVGPDGTVSGIPRALAVPADVWTDGRPIAGDLRARVELDADVLDQRPGALAGLLLVGHGTEPGGGLHPVDGGIALEQVLLASTAAGNPAMARRLFPLAARVARAPALRFEHGPDPATRLADAARLLDEADAQ